MKKLICLIIPVLLFLNFTTAFAATETEIYSDIVYAAQGETVTIPIKIRNNTGIMGFRLTFTYPDELESPQVLRGALLNEGLLNNSITEATNDSFDVVWSNTQNVTNDGTVLLLNFKVAPDSESGIYKIDISYNQADTFNEAMQDVVFCGKSVEIIIGEKSDFSTTEAAATQAVAQKPIEDVDSLFLKSVFEKALDSLNIESFELMSDEDFEKFKEFVSKELVNYGTSGKELDGKTKYEVEEIYNEASKDAFIDSVVNTVDSNVIDEAIKENLDAVGAESIDVIPPEKQQEFVGRVVYTLTENGAEIENLPDLLTDEQAMEIIESLSKRNEEEAGVSIDALIPEDKPKSFAPYIAVGVAAVVIIAAVAVLIIKRKNAKKFNEEDKQ